MSITAEFNQKLPVKAPSPFSLRLSADERRRLESEAKGTPLGTYIKAKLLGDTAPMRLRRSGMAIEDRASLAKALALLGQSRFANNLNQLTYLAHIGSLPFTPEIEGELHEALACVHEMRALLVQALGLKPGGSA